MKKLKIKGSIKYEGARITAFNRPPAPHDYIKSGKNKIVIVEVKELSTPHVYSITYFNDYQPDGIKEGFYHAIVGVID